MADQNWPDFRKLLTNSPSLIAGAIFFLLLTFHPNIEYLVQLLIGYAWPVSILTCVALLKDSVMNAVNAVADRIRDPNTSVRVGREGLEIKRLKEEEQAIENEQLREIGKGVLVAPPTEFKAIAHGTPAADESIPDELLRLADKYMKVNEPSYQLRVRIKDDLARQMAAAAVLQGISKERLASELHEGLILTLASMIHLNPEPEDYSLIYRVSDEANRLHVKYRIVLAIGRLQERRLIPQTDRKGMLGILDSYMKDADEALRRRIIYTRSLFDAD
jgi:hypothetical protein